MGSVAKEVEGQGKKEREKRSVGVLVAHNRSIEVDN